MNSFQHFHKLIERGERAHDIDLRGANCSGEVWSHLNADRLNLRAADLQEAKLHRTRFGGCQLEGAKLQKTDWSQATLRMCVLDGAHGADACFDGARIEDSTAIGADLSRASLRGAHLTETSFARAILRDAILDDAEGDGVELRGADLGGASLIGARLDEADFRGADLRGADLTRGRFRGADFRGALLDHANFEGTDCHGARFDEGAGPHAATTPKTGQTAARSFDDVAVTALRELLAQLPAVLAAREGPAAELIDRLQRAGDALNASAINRPEEWKPWVDRLAKMTNGQQPADLKAVLAALSEAPIGLQGEGAAVGSSAADILGHLRNTFEALTAASDHPPEEWKPLLELLMKMTTGDRPLDLKALLDQLSSFAQHPPNPNPPTAL